MKSTVQSKNQFGEQSNATLLGGSSRVFASFKIDNTQGAGVSGLVGSQNAATPPVLDIDKVNAHSTSPSGGNLNPPAGVLQLFLSRAFGGLNKWSASLQSPLSGSPTNVTSGLTVGVTYVIASVGTTTPAAWLALGLEAGITPAVGVAFICKTATHGTGTGTVDTPVATGIDHIELDANSAANLNVTGGGFLSFSCYAAGVLTAPAAGSIVTIALDLLAVPGPQI